MNPISWFEIPVIDMERAKKFYSQVFDYEFQDIPFGDAQMSFFPGKMENPGAAGSLFKGPMAVPSTEGVTIYIEINPDLQSAIDRVEEAGGKILLQKTSIGEFGFMGYFLDTEGNRVGLHSMQ